MTSHVYKARIEAVKVFLRLGCDIPIQVTETTDHIESGGGESMDMKKIKGLVLMSAIVFTVGVAPMATGRIQPRVSAAGINDNGHRATLDVARQDALKRLYIELATGKAFSGAEARVIGAFMRGKEITEIEADTVVSRALYVKNISNGELNSEQQGLLASFDALGVTSKGYDIASAKVQKDDSEIVYETEPNDAMEQSNSAQTDLFAGKLSGSSDVDMFAFSVPAGPFAVSLDGRSRNKKLRAEVNIELLDEGGNVLSPDSEFDGSARNSAQRLAVFTSPRGGKYYVRLSEASEGAVKYRLAAESLSYGHRPSQGDVSIEAFVNNGGFESGNFTGWTLFNINCFPGGNWFVYSGTNTPLSGFPFFAPPQGTFAAVSDQLGQGTHIMYQDITLEPGRAHGLVFKIYWQNRAAAFFSPNTLDCNVFPNQQFRIDIMTTTAAVDSVAPGDVLANVLRTRPGLPLTLPPITGIFNLSAFAGQTVRLRFAEVDNQLFFNVGVDDVRIVTH